MPHVATVHDKPDGTYTELIQFDWDGGSTLRITNFAGNETGAQLPYFVWNSQQWTKYPYLRGVLRESAGELPEWELSIPDPSRAIYAFVNAAKPKNATLTLYRVRVSDGQLIQTLGPMRIQRWSSAAGVIQVTIGASSVAEKVIPRLRLSRDWCTHPYEMRFRHDLLPGCSYPSDNFGLGTAHNMFEVGAGPSAETEALHGWFTQQAQGVEGVARPETRNSRTCMYLSKYGDNIRFSGSNYNALRISKKFPGTQEEDPLLDVQARLELAAVGGAPTWNATPLLGIYIQSINNPGQWVFCGFGNDPGDTIFRETDAEVSTTTEFTNSSYTAFRIQRTSTGASAAFNFFARAESYSAHIDDTNAWTQVGTATLSMGTVIRAGIVVGGDEIPGANRRSDGWAYHFRFLRGGLTRCSRKLADTLGCQLHKYTWAFNGVRLAPPGVVG